jgi:hypothetical protein
LDDREKELVKKVFPKDLVEMIFKEEEEDEKQNVKRNVKSKPQVQNE